MRFDKRFDEPFVYAKYEYQLAVEHIIPKFAELGIEIQGKKILDAGCGWGGSVVAFNKHRAKCTGIDLYEHQINTAKKFALEKKVKINFYTGDVCKLKTKDIFDVILFCDVIEYVSNPEMAIYSLKNLLKDEGILYITFAPWYGPYGGHQHHPDSITRFLPYSHLLPKSIFFYLLQNKKGLMFKNKDFLEEIKRIRDNKISIHALENLVNRAKMKIFKRNLYFLRPSFKIRMSMPTINLKTFGKIPIIRELITTGAEYFLTK